MMMMMIMIMIIIIMMMIIIKAMEMAMAKVMKTITIMSIYDNGSLCPYRLSTLTPKNAVFTV